MNEIKQSCLVEASVKAVYQKWISSDTVIPPARKMEVSAVVGGKYVIESMMGEEVWRMEGVFKEVLPDEKLVYSWEWNHDGDVSEVTALFAGEGTGTRIEVVHTGLSNELSFAAHAAGWESYLASFKALF